MKRWLLIGLLVLPACGSHVPPNLTPEAVHAWYGTKVLLALDAVEHVAVDGCMCAGGKAPVFSEATVRLVVDWHTAAYMIVNSASAGWVAAVNQSLDQLEAQLSVTDKDQLKLFLNLARGVLREATP